MKLVVFSLEGVKHIVFYSNGESLVELYNSVSYHMPHLESN